jgi:hypothetical protein
LRKNIKEKFTLEMTTKDQMSTGTALLFNLGARWEMGDQRHDPAALPPGYDPVLIVQEGG